MINNIKIRQCDLKKVLDFLNKECTNHIINISTNYPKITFISEQVNGEKVEIILSDDSYYMSPLRIRQEKL